MQTTAIGTVANSLPENEVILLTLLISKGYIPYTDLQKKQVVGPIFATVENHADTPMATGIPTWCSHLIACKQKRLFQANTATTGKRLASNGLPQPPNGIAKRPFRIGETCHTAMQKGP